MGGIGVRVGDDIATGMKHTSLAVWILILGVGCQGSLMAASGYVEEEEDPSDSKPVGNPVTATNPPPATGTNEVSPESLIHAEKAWRSFLHIQGQLEHALLAIELNRRESQATSQDNQQMIDEGLQSIEKVLQAQQEREMEALRESNRNMLIVAGAFAGVGFLAMFLTSLFHFRSMNRLASIASGMPLGGGYNPALVNMDEARLLESSSAGARPAGTRLLSAIERLERRVHELEHTSQGSIDPESLSFGEDTSEDGLESGDTGASENELSMLLGKGQALLSLGKSEEALMCFDLALTQHPDHAETLVKKGSALEKLNRLDEAIDCYNRAIEANQGMTLAYLYKGGLFNRMERYDEALACYEQALKTQQGAAAAEQAPATAS